MEIRQLDYFLAVAETLNVSRAATRVFVSQPALSRQIRLLEEELGVSLFERTARGMTLTDAGVLLRQRATSVVKDLASIKEDVGAHAAEAFGTVTLGIPSALQELLTTRVVARFAKQHPKALLRVREGTSRDIRDGLASGDVDVAFLSAEEPSNPFEWRTVLTETLVAIALPDDGLTMTRPISVQSLCYNPLILTPYPNSLRTLIDRAAAGVGAEVRISVEADQSTLMLDLVRQGLGYAILPYCAAHEPLKAGLVSVCPIENLHMSWNIAFSKERSLSTAARSLYALLSSEAEQLVIHQQWPTAVLTARGGQLGS